DVYVDPSQLTATITSATGGNFENLVVGTAAATAHVNDTIDATTVNLSASTVSRSEDRRVGKTATSPSASQGDNTIVTDEGTITSIRGHTVTRVQTSALQI